MKLTIRISHAKTGMLHHCLFVHYSKRSSVCAGHAVFAIAVYSELNREFLCPGH